MLRSKKAFILINLSLFTSIIYGVLPNPSDGWVGADLVSISFSGQLGTNWDPAVNVINGEGLNSDLTHTASGAGNWTCHIDDGRWLAPRPPYVANLSPSGIQGDGWIQFTFSTPQAIGEMWVWNYNASNNIDRGYEYIYIDYSIDGSTWIRLMNGGQNFFTFAAATGTDNYACNNKINFGGVLVKKIALTARFVDGIYGDPSYGGLSEVLFKKAPVSASSPFPANGATDVMPSAVALSWQKGSATGGHDLFFGTDQAAVAGAEPFTGDINGNGSIDWNDLQLFASQWLANEVSWTPYWADSNADASVNFLDMAALSQNWLNTSDGIYRGHYVPSVTSYNAGNLEAGTTYYWRVDEYDGSTTWLGDVWSFTTYAENLAKSPFAIAVPSSQVNNASFEVENVIDVNANSFWVSNYSTFPNWVELRWPQPVFANSVIVDEMAGNLSATYKIDVFDAVDNSWRTVAGPKSNLTPGQTIRETFPKAEITKLRYYALTPYAGATQSAVSSMQVRGSGAWLEAGKENLPQFEPDSQKYPAVSSSANFACTSFLANPSAVMPGGNVSIKFGIRKNNPDDANYGFQVRIGEPAVPSAYFDYARYADYTIAISGIKPQVPTREWIIGRDYEITANVYIPPWALHGDVPVTITPLCANSRGVIINVANNIVGSIKVQKFETDPALWPAITPTSQVIVENGQPNLYINGAKVEPYIMTTPDYTSAQSIGEQAVAGCRIWRVLTTKNVDASYGTPEGDAENAACFAELDQKIINVLKADPNAYILPAFLLRASSAWTTRWPNEATLLSNGTRQQYSLSSAKWASQLDYDYRALVAHLMSASYSGHVIGVSYEMAKETQYWGCWENNSSTLRTDMVLADLSLSHINAFRSWLRVKYNYNVSALRTAWNEPTVTFENAYPTASILRQEDSTLMFKDPARTRKPIDYWEFHAGEMAKMAILPAKAVKEASGNKYITGLWGFYGKGVYATGLEPGKLVHMGHTALQSVLASPYIDYLAVLQSYSNRQWGEPFAAYNMIESIRQHGKMAIVELDTRTFFTPIYFTERTFSEPETMSVLYTDIWGAAIRGDALWWVGFPAGATYSNRTSIPWFASESVTDAIALGKKHYEAIRTTASPSRAEVAVFINNADVHAMDAYDGYKPQVSAQYQTSLFELTKLGTPVDYYELNDINLPIMSQYKVFVFLSAYNITNAQSNAIKTAVRQSGKTAVWLYGAGYNNGSTNSAANVTDLIGITTEVTLERRLPTIALLSGHTLTANVPAGYTISPHAWEHDPNPCVIGPIFNVNDSAAEQLGTYSHNGKTAYAAKNISGSTSIFLAIPYISSLVLRDICRASGVFLYSQNDLYLDADEHFVVITAGNSGFNGTISLPQSSTVYDIWNKNTIGSGSSFNANVPAKHSRIYFYGSSAEAAQFRSKVE